MTPLPETWVEAVYSRGIFPLWAAVCVPLTGALPFPVGPALVPVALIALSILSMRTWLRGRREGRSRRALFLAASRRGLLGVSWLYFLFLACWGASYARVPLDRKLQLEERDLSGAEVEELAGAVIEGILRDFTPPDQRDGPAALASARESLLEVFHDWYGERPALSRHVKRLPPGTLMAFGTSGMAFPYTLEPLVDGGLPEVGFLPVATHELVHVAGIAHEGEADFVAAVAGLRARNSYARYAAALRVYRVLRAELSARRRRELDGRLPGGAVTDIQEIQQAYRRREVRRLARIQGQVFDAHLKLQGLEQGVKDYSRAVKFLHAARRQGILTLEPPPAAAR